MFDTDFDMLMTDDLLHSRPFLTWRELENLEDTLRGAGVAEEGAE